VKTLILCASYVKKIVETRIFSIRYAADDDAGVFRKTAGFPSLILLIQYV
jgi:hypothetical protein